MKTSYKLNGKMISKKKLISMIPIEVINCALEKAINEYSRLSWGKAKNRGTNEILIITEFPKFYENHDLEIGITGKIYSF